VNINIEVVDVTVESVPRPSGKGNYEKMTVVFKGYDNKVESKSLMDWATNKEVWNVLVNSKKGDTFAIEREKDNKGYWNWTGIAKQDMPVTKSEPAKAFSKPTYETPEERAQRQVYIIRQSSLTNAVNLLGPKAKVQDVINVADEFVNYVLQSGVEHLTDDPV
jgi:hypothetical protein